MNDNQKLHEVEIKLDGVKLLDADGYPTQACHDLIEKWEWEREDNWSGLFALLKKVWRYDEYFWEEDGTDDITDKPIRRYHISTAGWSGNEELISAMKANHLFWMVCWVSSRRGGHYVFELKKE
jgi:hypothetical protein